MKSQGILHTLAVVLLLSAPSVRAQEQQQQQPLPANGSQSSDPNTPLQPIAPDQSNDNGDRTPPVPGGRGLFLGSNGPVQDSDQDQPDSRVLAGAETFGLGSLHGPPNDFNPALFVTESVATGIVSSNTDLVSSFGGTLSLDKAWKRVQLTVGYSGAENLYRPDGFEDSPYQDLSASMSTTRGRWVLRLRDDFSLSRQSPFGGLYTGGQTPLTDASLTSSISPTIATGSETILTGLAERFSNTSIVETDYSVSRRSTLTMSGSYGILDFIDPGYINGRFTTGQGGYSYLLSPANSVGVTYSFNQFNYSDTAAQTHSHLVQVNFGRKLTGRMALQAGAGPQYIVLEDFGPSSGHSWAWSAFGVFRYELRRTGYSLSYSHGINGGSGVYFSAETDTVAFSAHHQFTRFWTGTAGGGYSINKNLTQLPAILGTQQFNNVFVSANLARALGRHFYVGLNYSIQHQVASGPCPVLSCGTVPTIQMGGVTLRWQLKPNG